MKPAALKRLQAKGWRVVARGDGHLFDLSGPTLSGRLTCIGEEFAWSAALALERWEGMEQRPAKQLDLFAIAA